ncbi:MAG: hypothetical protein ACM3H8_15345 [Sphingobacteriales bacterium]
MKSLFIFYSNFFFLVIANSTKAQNSHLGGGAILGTSLSEKTNPRLGVYFQFERTLNQHNEILAGISNPHFYTKNQGQLSASVIKAGWRYMLMPDKIYGGINAGMVFENFVTTRYGKGWGYHPMLEINSDV